MAFGRNKEIEKRMLIKQTINSMNKQIQKLEEQKEVYLRAGKEAKERGLEAQYNLALSGLKMTMAQQKRVYEMKLNFEITSQMKDMTVMTTEFLKGMSSLSKDMVKLSKEKDFKKVEKQFAEKGMFTCHSAAVEKDGKAILLLGNEGAGKTSLALNLCINKKTST